MYIRKVIDTKEKTQISLKSLCIQQVHVFKVHIRVCHNLPGKAYGSLTKCLENQTATQCY